MTDYRDILCLVRDDQPPYAYCHDGKGERSRTRVISHTYDKNGDLITQLQCNENAEHRFRIDREGNVIDENGRCKTCD